MAILINKYDIEAFENPIEETSKKEGFLSRIKRWLSDDYQEEIYKGFNNINDICRNIINNLPEHLAIEVQSKGFFISKYHPYLWNSDNFNFYWLDVHNPSEELKVELDKQYRSLAFKVEK